jgi:uncharacterized protein (TIGR03435 family)
MAGSRLSSHSISAGALLLLSLASLARVGLAQQAQRGARESDKTPEFEVATIKPHPVGHRDFEHAFDMGRAERYEARNLTVKELVESAFELPTDQVNGGPPWISKDYFDVEAKMSEADWAAVRDQSSRQQTHLKHLMLQSLLRDRLALQIAHQPKELKVYALTQAKGGAKLRPAGSPPPKEEGPSSGWGITIRDQTVDDLCDFLAVHFERVVLNQTGLSGTYNSGLGVPSSASDAPEEEGDGPVIHALEDQLGLTLISKRAVVDTIVITHLDKPTAN